MLRDERFDDHAAVIAYRRLCKVLIGTLLLKLTPAAPPRPAARNGAHPHRRVETDIELDSTYDGFDCPRSPIQTTQWTSEFNASVDTTLQQFAQRKRHQFDPTEA